MRVTVLYFSLLRVMTGRDGEEFDMAEGASVGDALAAAAKRHPGLGLHASSAMTALNEQWAPRSARLSEGDVVALTPPVSGG